MRADESPPHLVCMFNYLTTISNLNGVPKLSNLDTVGEILGIFLNVLMGSGFAIAVASIGYSAIQYALSMGEPKQVAQAWNAFIWGVLAAAISIGALGVKAAVLGAAGVVSSDITNALPSF